MVLEKQVISLEELIEQREAKIEIIDSQVIRKPSEGGIHQIVASNLLRVLNHYVRESDCGVILACPMTYLMNSDSAGLKDSFVPDVSYISHDNVPSNWDVEKPHPSAPDLAIEILSPSDSPDITKAKVRTYLAQGTKQVWLVYPKAKEIEQYNTANPDEIKTYRDSNEIDTQGLFPEIQGLTTDAIFKLPKWAIKHDNDT